jgi:hypothetical protein
VIVPIDVVHITESFVVVPWIVAVNCTLPPGTAEAATGATATDATLGLVVAAVPCSDSTTGRCRTSVMIVRLPLTLPTVADENFTRKL